MCAVYRCQIIGLIVAEIKETTNLPKEDTEILATGSVCPSLFGGGSHARKSDQRIGYILSLGNLTKLPWHMTNNYSNVLLTYIIHPFPQWY